MSTTTRVNGDGFFATDAASFVTVAQLKAFLITVKNDGGAAVDLRTLDDGVDKLVSLVIKEIQPLMYEIVNDASGVIHAIVDGHAVDADTLQLRLRHVVAGKLGHLPADNDTTVVTGLSFAVSGSAA